MHELIPQLGKTRVTQAVGRVDAKALNGIDQLILVLPKRPTADLWRSLPQGTRLQSAMQKRPADATPALETRINNNRQTLVVGTTLAADASAFDLLSTARKLVAAVTSDKPGILGICVLGVEPDKRESVYNAVLSAALAAAFELPSFKRKPATAAIRSIRLLGLDAKLDISRCLAEASGNNLARWLTALPPNKLDAENYAAMARDLAGEHGWQYKRYSVAELQKLGAGAFLAVAQGNEDDSASIVRLRYRPGSGTDAPLLSLVGKGIVFDTGGTNLKPFASMLNMHGDMQGSAVALGTLLAITLMQLPMPVDCWLAITENRTGPRAYKSQDIVRALNGKTIQTIHTDAEGRMVLADTLTLASRERPALLIDFATLTGAVVGAITSRYSGVFTNRSQWHPRLKRTGETSGERVWPFPMGEEFLEDLKSDIADIMQCSPEATGDHILAASFLAEFVEEDTPWVHVDLAASNKKGGLAQVPTEITGFGVRYTMSLLLDEKLLQDR